MTIVCTELVKEFRMPAESVLALNGVSLTVPTGSFLAIGGASGSGKSTLLNLMAGLETPTSGSVQIDGVEIGSLSEGERARARLERVGVIFQDNNLIDEFTLLENVLIPLLCLDQSRDLAEKSAMGALDRLGVGELAKRRPREVSGGQRQRAGIARAISGPRTVLLADEPTGALDGENSRALFASLAALADEGTTVVVASHDPLAGRYATQTLQLADGRVQLP